MGRPITIQLDIFSKSEQGEKVSAHIRRQIGDAREEKDLSQRELSKRIKRSSAYISQLEAGRIEPTALDLIAIAIALEKPLAYFFPQSIKSDENGLSDKEWQLVWQFRRIKSSDAQDVAIKQVRQLADLKPKGSK